MIVKNNKLIETKYEIKEELKNSTLFGIGNGYFGIRGSLEEFGENLIQGTYIRGVFDQIIEIPFAVADNEYMKNYYFDIQKLKEFEYEDSCINICDPLLFKVFINNEQLLPWKCKVVKWKRYIDYKTGQLERIVTYESNKGLLTNIIFKRVASFDNDHIILQEVTIEKLNHNEDVFVISGIDTLAKTNGQKKSIVESEEGKTIVLSVGDKYNIKCCVIYQNETDALSTSDVVKVENHIYAEKFVVKSSKQTFKKIIYINSSCDYKENEDFIKIAKDDFNKLENFDILLKKHINKYKKCYSQMKIKVNSNKTYDTLINYSIYQTLIGFNRNDSVHSLSAKNLTAEKYNQFVWWDCEIFQLPIFLATFPKESINCINYRYKCLNQAKTNAKSAGYNGAMFPFCSSVDGKENVWIYARHPFLQIHINSDVAYGIINYYTHTKNDLFMSTKGLEMLIEIVKYFISRSHYINDRYEILNVTGTDEHHPYINNNTYTNYEVHYVVEKTLYFIEKYRYVIDEDTHNKIKKYAAKLFLPQKINGILPQFDNYFDLSKSLKIEGNGIGKNFQMRQSGLYHKSQIIKQPDVLMLFSYLNIDMPNDYEKEYKYYYKMCESSSSLSYPVHAICALDNKDYKTFLENFEKTLKIDIDDVHNCAYQGIHAACTAGGWYVLYRGLFGFKSTEQALLANPHLVKEFNDIEINFMYHNVPVKASIKNKYFCIKTTKIIDKLIINGQKYLNVKYLNLKIKGDKI